MDILQTLFPYLCGGSGLLTYGLAYKERRANKNLTEAKVMASMQEIYQRMFNDMRTKMDEMKSEIERLRQIIENSPKPCDSCPNIKK